MHFVAEHGNADVFGLDSNIAGVTGDTVAGDAECLPSVVAGAAGPAPLHHLHGDMVAVILLFEDARVADVAFEGVSTVAEDNRADTLGLDGEFINHLADTSHPPHAAHAAHADSMQNRDRRTNQQQNHY
jgi:hypothetical protein